MVVVFLIECDATVQGKAYKFYIYLAKLLKTATLIHVFASYRCCEFCQFNKLHEGFFFMYGDSHITLSSNLLIKGLYYRFLT